MAEPAAPTATGVIKTLAMFLKTLAIAVSNNLKNLPSKMTSCFQSTLRIKKAVDFASDIKNLWVGDRRRAIHCFKVALAVTFVSSVYYIRPLYEGGIGDGGITAALVVISVYEYTAGDTLSKCINNALATLLGCALGVGAESLGSIVGPTLKPVVLASLVFLVVAAVTFARFIPNIKKRYEYGALMFVAAFTFVSMSGYRVDKIIELARQRASAISLGAFTSIFASAFVFPVWAGEDLHKHTVTNIEKLASFLEGFGGEYYRVVCEGDNKVPSLDAYKSILDSEADKTEKSMADSAWWEIRWYGEFRFDHPWNQYLKIGVLSRECAYHIEALSGYLDAKVPPSEFQIIVQEPCMKMSSEVGKTLKELGKSMNLMVYPCTSLVHMENCKKAIEDLNAILKGASVVHHDILKAIPVIATTAILVDVIKCVAKISDAVQELSKQARFKKP